MTLTREQAVRIGNMADEAWCDTIEVRADTTTPGRALVTLHPYDDEERSIDTFAVDSDGEVSPMTPARGV